MPNLLLPALLLLTLALPATAQKARIESRGGARPGLRNGLIFGGVGAQIDGDKMSGYHKPGVTVGGVSVIPLSDHWNARFAILYTQKGARSRSADSANTNLLPTTPLPGQLSTGYVQQQPGFWLRYRLNYVQIPVLAEWRVRPNLSLQGGLSFDYLLRATADYGTGYGPPQGVCFRPVDLMGHFGVEYAFANRWAVDMQFSYSLRDISTEKVGTDKYAFFVGRIGGYRNNLLATTLRFYLSDPPAYKGKALFRTPAEKQADEADGEPTTP